MKADYRLTNLQGNSSHNEYGSISTNTESASTKSNVCAYVSIVIKGIIACASVSGLWSILSNVSTFITFRTKPADDFYTFDIYDGLSCQPHGWNTQDAHCNTIAQQMANDSASYSGWDCQHLVDGKVNLVYDQHFVGFRNYFVCAVVFIVIAAISAIVHDSALIYYHGQSIQQIRDFQFFPTLPLSHQFPISDKIRNLSIWYFKCVEGSALSGCFMNFCWYSTWCIVGLLISPFCFIFILSEIVIVFFFGNIMSNVSGQILLSWNE